MISLSFSLSSTYLLSLCWKPNSLDVLNFRVGAYPERLRVGPHGVELPVGVELGAADRLKILEHCHWLEGGSGTAVDVTGDAGAGQGQVAAVAVLALQTRYAVRQLYPKRGLRNEDPATEIAQLFVLTQIDVYRLEFMWERGEFSVIYL